AALYDPARHHTHALLFGQDPDVICKAYGAVALGLQGYPDAARRQSDEAVRRSRGLSPSSQAMALHFAAMLHQLRRDGPQVRTFAEAVTALAAEHGFSFWRAGGTVLGGWALAVGGGAARGLAPAPQGAPGWGGGGRRPLRT